MTDHKSDCAVHNEPAMPAGPCDCGADSIVEAMTQAIEIEMDRDFEAWRARWVSVTGIADDAPDPPAGQYATSPEKMARAALTAALDHMREPLSEDAIEEAADAYHDVAVEKKALFETEKYKAAGLVYRGIAPVEFIEPMWQAMLDQLRKEALGDN